MCVLVVLLAGGAEAQRPTPATTLFGILGLGVVSVDAQWQPGSECVKFSDIYADGQDLIERMWGGAFKYTPDQDGAAGGYTMWWFEGGTPGQADAHDNPNDLITQGRGLTVPDVCHLDYFHKDVPSPEGDDFTECHPWHASSCCHDSTVVTPHALKIAYGAGYEWDRCGPLSQACERFFVEEACLYECDVNAGLWRKFSDEQHSLCEAAAQGATVTLASGAEYTCSPDPWGAGNAENKWQLEDMPIRASYADSWFRACANDLFCGSGDYFECAGEYHTYLAEQEAAAAAAVALSETCATNATLAATDECIAYLAKVAADAVLAATEAQAAADEAHAQAAAAQAASDAAVAAAGTAEEERDSATQDAAAAEAAAAAAQAEADAALAVAAAERQRANDKEDEIPGWGVAVIIAAGVLVVIFAVVVCVMYSAEKQGKPVFMTLDGAKAGDANVKTVASTTSATAAP